MEEHSYSGFREAAGPDDGDVRAQARRALQDSYDWRDDDQRRAGAAPAASAGTAAASDARGARDAARRLRRSTSRTVGV